MFILLLIHFAPLLKAVDIPMMAAVDQPRTISIWDSLGLDQDECDFDAMLQEEAVVGPDVEPNGYDELEPNPGVDNDTHNEEKHLPPEQNVGTHTLDASEQEPKPPKP